MKKLFLLFVLAIFTTTPVLAQQSTPDNRFGAWMTFYYKDKDSSQTGDFMKWLQTSQILEKKPNAAQPLAAFMSVIFADNPTKVSSWLKADKFTGNTKTAIEMALWLAGNQAELKTYASDATKYAKPAPKLSEMQVSGPADLDMMWGAFQASANTIYVKKIIDALGSSDPMIQGAAQWSLGSNMRQHELVNQIVQSEAKTQTGMVKQKLDELVAKASSPAKTQ